MPAKRDTQSLPPLFLTKKLRETIERLLPASHHERLRHYFNNYGCLRCSRKHVLYRANGFCELCFSMIGKRIRKLDKALEAQKSAHPPKIEEAYLRPYNSARQLLADLRAVAKRPIRGQPYVKSPPKVYLKF